MPNNVKSCKKINEKAQTAKFTVFAREISSAVLKPGKLGKLKRKLLKIFKYYTISRVPPWESFPKMWYFLGARLFKGELLAVKVKSNFKKKIGSEEALRKKVTATILIFLVWHGISGLPIGLVPRWFRGGPEKSKLWPWLFFLTPLNFANGPKISKSVDFEQQ